MHVNKHGNLKPALTRTDAIAQALRLDIERQTDPARRPRGPVEAYECSFCGWWHIGTRRPALRRSSERVEIGDRAWWNLLAENKGRGSTRLRVLIHRGKRRGREAVSSRHAVQSPNAPDQQRALGAKEEH